VINRVWNKDGFTLIEVMVAMAILAVLSVLIVGAISIAREEARLTHARSMQHNVESGMKDATLAHWNFDEGSPSTTTTDSWSQSPSVLTLSGGQWVDGVNGTKAYQFGNSGFMNANPTNTSNLKGVRTAAFWFKIVDADTNNQGGFMTLVGNDPVSGSSKPDAFGTSTTRIGDLTCPSGQIVAADTGLFINPTNDFKWHYFVLSKTSTSQVKLCIDGNCKDISSTNIYYIDVTQIIFNGANGCGWGNFDKGVVIDDFSLYSKAL
jgi:prepilin-type N-terminal cleavage/methylation domain-containing protein